MSSRFRSKAIVWLRAALRRIYSSRLIFRPRLRELLQNFKGSASAAVDPADAIALYEAVRSRRPNSILELGPGTSTAVMALAIADIQAADASYKPRFIAVEENPDWLNFHRKHMPIDLAGLVDMRACSITIKEVDGTRAAAYVDLPLGPFDLVHIDGPTFIEHGVTITSDIVDISDHLAPSCHIIFDGRQASARFARPRLEAVGFRFRRHPFSLNHEFSR